ncbi:uncharacterized protein LOC118405147 [Branchiostoma floridae]|uniref:Uncharacterized protein LOC118405147 n=1 Tax=Branchiostoma floridae TaxID=7739 RepID=A0A9J7HM68_BRAFL|nr:uncharacterized protein LOC118405147 [Branchiostoma floridae]
MYITTGIQRDSATVNNNCMQVSTGNLNLGQPSSKELLLNGNIGAVSPTDNSSYVLLENQRNMNGTITTKMAALDIINGGGTMGTSEIGYKSDDFQENEANHINQNSTSIYEYTNNKIIRNIVGNDPDPLENANHAVVDTATLEKDAFENSENSNMPENSTTDDPKYIKEEEEPVRDLPNNDSLDKSDNSEEEVENAEGDAQEEKEFNGNRIGEYKMAAPEPDSDSDTFEFSQAEKYDQEVDSDDTLAPTPQEKEIPSLEGQDDLEAQASKEVDLELTEVEKGAGARSIRQIKSSLEEKVRRLQEEKKMVEDKIRLAQEEEQIRAHERSKYQRQLRMCRRDMMLRRLRDLGVELEDQAARLQVCYSSLLSMKMENWVGKDDE